MYELSTTHRAAALTWLQRNILLDLCEQEKMDAPESRTVATKIAKRLNRPATSILAASNRLQGRGLVGCNCVDPDLCYLDSLSWHLTEDGEAAIKSLEKE